jgi:hypothetical protein
MSLEKIDQYIKELMAIKYYDTVKLERDNLSKEVEGLRAELSNREAKVKELSQINEDSEKKIAESDKRIESLGNELKIKDANIKQSEERVKQLEARISELEGLKVIAEGNTLKEAKEAFLKAREEEIKMEAENLFNGMKTEWEKNVKPKEVLNEAIKWLSHTVEVLSKPGPRFFLKEVDDAGLPDKVEGIISVEVKRRIDAEFLKRVEEESERKAKKKLEHLSSIEWPNWYKLNVEPRILGLEHKIKSNVVAILKGPWNIVCDKCNMKQSVELTPQGIEDVLRSGYVEIECSNPNCTDSSWFTTWRHKIRKSLSDLISTYISEHVTAPVY